MNKNLINSLVHGALIVTLTSDITEMKSRVEPDRKLLLQPNGESKLNHGLLVHTAETSPEETLIRLTDACNSGVQAISQAKPEKYEFVYASGLLFVNEKPV